MKKEILSVIFYHNGEAVEMAEDFEFTTIPRIGEKISFDISNHFEEKIIEKIEHRYSDSPNLNHLVKIYCK